MKNLIQVLTKNKFDEMVKDQVESKRGKHFGLSFEKYDLGQGEYVLRQRRRQRR